MNKTKNKMMNKKKKIDFFKLIVSVVSVLLVGFFSSFFGMSAIENWYQTLSKPIFSPPNWIFGPVWTVLYILIGVSFYFVWTSGVNRDAKKRAYLVFAVQIFLNFFWTVLFFGNQMIFGALVDISLLWIAILLNIFAFYRISKISGILLIPYFLWVSFAALLNYSLWVLNK